MTMNPYWKSVWLNGLEGGEFEQGKRQLCNGWTTESPTYCCLGVLAKLSGAKPVHVPEYAGAEPATEWRLNGITIGRNGVLTTEGLELFGITEDEQTHLTSVNDGNGGHVERSFYSIAGDIRAWM